MKIVQEVNWNLAKADPNTGKLLNKNGKSIMQQCFEDFYFGSDTEDVEYTDVTNDPAHVAFLGHELNSK